MAETPIGGNPRGDPPGQSGTSEGATILDLVIILVKRRRLVLGVPVLAAILSAIVSLAWPNTYTAVTRILAPQQSQANALAILGTLGGLGPASLGGLSARNPNDVYVAMLKSRTNADSLIKRFKLQDVYGTGLLEDTRGKLEKNTAIVSGRDSVIAIEVEDRDPRRAADLANAYVEGLEAITLDLAVSEASQRRLFFEKQLKQTKDGLAHAEVELKLFKESKGLVQPEGQAGLSVSASAALRAQITAKEIQLTALRTFSTEHNPQLILAQQELAGIRSQLQKLESQASQGRGDVLVSLGKAPATALEYTVKLRDVKYFETLFEIMARQYEAARIDEAKNATLVQTLDKALVPERRSWPRLRIIVPVFTMIGLLLGVGAAFFLEYLENARSDPGRAERLARFMRRLRER